MAPLTSVAIAVISAIKSINTIVNIIASMGMDNIDYHEKTKAVRFVH